MSGTGGVMGSGAVSLRRKPGPKGQEELDRIAREESRFSSRDWLMSSEAEARMGSRALLRQLTPKILRR